MTSNATWCDAQGHSAIAEVALVAFYSHGFMRLIYTDVHVSSSLQISVLLETQACISHDLVTNHRHQHCIILYSCVVHFQDAVMLCLCRGSWMPPRRAAALQQALARLRLTQGNQGT